MIFALLLLATLPLPSASAQTAQQQTEHSFIDACVNAFRKSTTPMEEEPSRKICECTVKDSHIQGVKLDSLKKEGEKMSADPKYQIHDEALMNAFRYCTIRLYQESEGDHGD